MSRIGSLHSVGGVIGTLTGAEVLGMGLKRASSKRKQDRKIVFAEGIN